MHRFALMLLLAAGPLVAELNTDQIYEDSYAKYTAWSYACELTVLCDGSFVIPNVVYEEMRPRLRGYYNGTDTIYISSALQPGVDQTSTLIHEMIHYIHGQRGLAPAKAFFSQPQQVKKMCWSEEEAFRLGDVWLRSQGHPDKARGKYWWKAYWHCEPFYNENFEPFDWFLRGVGG